MKEVRITEVGGIFLAKSLIITEKPSVAQEFARILGVSGRNDGYIENSDYVTPPRACTDNLYTAFAVDAERLSDFLLPYSLYLLF